MSKADHRTTIKGDRKPLYRAQIGVPVASVRQHSDPLSPLSTQLVFGTRVNVFDIDGGWGLTQEIQRDGQGYVGYIAMDDLGADGKSPTHRVSILKAPVFTKPDLKSPIRDFLPLNAALTVDGNDGDYHRVTDLGYVHAHHIVPVSDAGDDYVAKAEQHIGLPYVWGGVSSDGLDCSGLVQSALRAVGRDAPRDSDMQERDLGQKIDIGDDIAGLKRGDLVFWQGHVGIMSDPDTLLHANAYHMQTVKESIHEAARRIKKTAGPITSIKRLD